MALLYGGLDAPTAGEIVAALEAMDVRTDVRGEAIYVPKNRRDEARLALARQGLPRQGQPGYELLDDINGYATTSEMFDAAYWRAKEGELARTILASTGIKSVRVHLGIPKSNAFSPRNRRVRASVTITMARGRMDPQQAMAIRYLVALAVPDLEPEQVTVIDSARGLILKPGADNDAAVADPEDRAQLMEQKLVELLEAHVGPGNVRVNIAIAFNRERETFSEMVIDPESRVLKSREATELNENGVQARSAVSVASNLPEGDATTGNASESEVSETREKVEYGFSESQREIRKEPGATTRLTVAVLVNESLTGEDGGGVLARTPEQLTAIRDLVAASVGYDEARGDIISVKSMAFHVETTDEGEIATKGWGEFTKTHSVAIAQILVSALIVLLLVFFVLKPALTRSPDNLNLTAGQIAGTSVNAAQLEGAALDVAGGEGESKQALSPVDELRVLAATDAETSKKILKEWLGETGEAA